MLCTLHICPLSTIFNTQWHVLISIYLYIELALYIFQRILQGSLQYRIIIYICKNFQKYYNHNHEITSFMYSTRHTFLYSLMLIPFIPLLSDVFALMFTHFVCHPVIGLWKSAHRYTFMFRYSNEKSRLNERVGSSLDIYVTGFMQFGLQIFVAFWVVALLR